MLLELVDVFEVGDTCDVLSFICVNFALGHAVISRGVSRMECLYGRPVKVCLSCLLVGTVKMFCQKGLLSFVNRGSVSLSRSKCLGLINL